MINCEYTWNENTKSYLCISSTITLHKLIKQMHFRDLLFSFHLIVDYGEAAHTDWNDIVRIIILNESYSQDLIFMWNIFGGGGAGVTFSLGKGRLVGRRIVWEDPSPIVEEMLSVSPF